MSPSHSAGSERPEPQQGLPEDVPPNPWSESGIGTDVIAYLLAGPMVFGVPAWFLDRRYDLPLVLALAIVAGMTMSMYVIWLRYGRQ